MTVRIHGLDKKPDSVKVTGAKGAAATSDWSYTEGKGILVIRLRDDGEAKSINAK